MHYFKSNLFLIIILITIIVNGLGMVFPILRNDDALLYANIVKNIINNNDWLNLTHYGNDWLDKPHFPFWVTAFFFSILGINSVAYILPGFLFHLLGAFYTYKLAKELYDREIGQIAAIIYLTSFHLMLSSIDVRAEAYLLGLIMPACYYWYLYNKFQQIKWKYLFLGAFFTALAIMTKGLFVLVLITSGLITLWFYNSQYMNFFKLKWVLALILSFILIIPELIALYIQFDLHPDKIIYGKSNVSGIKWFFWDSQFGRFFNSGPITHTGVNSFDHYWFFIHTFLWSFLPWALVFILAIVSSIKAICNSKINNKNKSTYPNNLVSAVNKNLVVDNAIKHPFYNPGNIYYLFGSFIPTFILFSLTSFQLDYYINILIPFAAILCAFYLVYIKESIPKLMHRIFYMLTLLSVILVLIASILGILIFKNICGWIISGIGILILVLYFGLNRYNDLIKSIVYPALAINLVFILIMLTYGKVYIKYDIGYQASLYLNKKPSLPLIDYRVYSLPLEFYSKFNHTQINDLLQLKEFNVKHESYYAIVREEDLALFKKELINRNIEVLSIIQGTTIDKLMTNLFDSSKLSSNLEKYLIIKIN